MKEILEEISQNQDLKKELLQGRQVDLAEELSKKCNIRNILSLFLSTEITKVWKLFEKSQQKRPCLFSNMTHSFFLTIMISIVGSSPRFLQKS